MPGERDLSREKNWHYGALAERAIARLKRNRFEAVYAADRSEALAKVLEMIPEGSTIGFGDSVTLQQIGLFDHLHTRKPAEIFRPHHFDDEGYPMHSLEEMFRLMRKVLTADVYISGLNAITLDGKLVSTDGLGNRVAPMIFGPGRVILVAGANKIVPDAEAARDRIRRVCAPINVKRHIEKRHVSAFGELPCAKTGICTDCKLPLRICAATVILECSGLGFEPKRVVIVGEELGI